MINKRAEVSIEMLNLTWRVFIMVVIVLATVYSVGTVFSSKQDVRPVETALLARAVTDCIAPKGIASENFSLGACITTTTPGYFVNATLVSFESNFSRSESFDLVSIKNDCALAASGVGYPNAPICTLSKSYVLISNKGKLEQGVLSIETGIKKVEQNV